VGLLLRALVLCVSTEPVCLVVSASPLHACLSVPVRWCGHTPLFGQVTVCAVVVAVMVQAGPVILRTLWTMIQGNQYLQGEPSQPRLCLWLLRS
jgi:hypothetical protein